MGTLYLDIENYEGLRTCRIVGTVLGTLREEEYLVAKIDPPIYRQHEGPTLQIDEVILAIYRGESRGSNAKLTKVMNQYFGRDEGVQEVINALQRGEVPPALAKIAIDVTCVIPEGPILTRKVDERRLEKIGCGALHTDPEVLRPKRKPPGFWSFLWWRIRDCLEGLGLFPGRR